MASLQLSSASDMSAEVTTLTDFLRNEVNDDENEILQTTGQLCSLLSTIDTLRVKAHELLEAETISASKLRFKLNTLQQTFEVELAGATEAARAYLALQKRNEEMCIHEVNAAKAEARRKQSELELESRDLAQRIMSRERKYREQVSDVNEIMTNRSKVKISLNETEAELQSVLGKTQQCEQNRLRLQERAKESLNEFVMDMNGLSTSLEEVKKALACENEKKRHLSRKCDEIEEDVIRAKNKMEIAEKVLSDAVSRLESEIDLRRELEVSIVEARKKAEELSKECVDIQEKCRSGRKNLHSEERQLAEQHRMMVKAVEEIRVEVDTLFAKHRKAQAALMKEMKLKDKHQSAVSNIRKSSTSAKEKLKYQSEKGAELQTENRNLDLQLKECSETSIIVKRQLQDQIEKLNDESEHKESLRMRLEKDTERLRQGILALESKLEGMATQLKDNEESNSHICSTSAKKVVIFDCVVCECKYFQA
jgi:chromosome segregation ATPase